MWEAIIPAAISAVGGLIGAEQTNSAQDQRQNEALWFNSIEAQKSRDFNAAEANIQRIWSAGQAERQMGFQSDMSGTAYQRAMKDMRSAGLNPILAYSQGGASTPGGASGSAAAAHAGAASSPPPQPVLNKGAAAADAAGRAFATAQQLATIENVNAQTDKARAEAEYTRTQERHLQGDFKDEPTGENVYPKFKTYSAQEKHIRAVQMDAEARHELQKMDVTHITWDKVNQEIKNAVAENRRIEATTGNTEADTVLKKLRQSEESAGSEFWKRHPEWYGIREGIKGAEGVVNSAAKGLGAGLSLTPGGRSARVVQHLHRRIP